MMSTFPVNLYQDCLLEVLLVIGIDFASLNKGHGSTENFHIDYLQKLNCFDNNLWQNRKKFNLSYFIEFSKKSN